MTIRFGPEWRPGEGTIFDQLAGRRVDCRDVAPNASFAMLPPAVPDAARGTSEPLPR